MKPTRIPVLVALALVIGVATWAVVGRVYDALPGLSIYGPITIGLLAAVELVFAVVVRRRIRHPMPGHRIDPIFVARLAVLAKASSHTGAILLGVYGGFFAYTITALGRGRLSVDARTSAIAAAITLGWVICALFLENSCKVPPDGPRGRAT